MECKCKGLNEIEGREAEEFVDSHLKQIRVGNWEIEYVCPETGIRWLMDYPHGDWQGGGPARLRRLPLAAPNGS